MATDFDVLKAHSLFVLTPTDVREIADFPVSGDHLAILKEALNIHV